MAKYIVLDDRAKRDLNKMCKTLGYNFPLGDWLGQIDAILDKLDGDAGVSQRDFDDTLGIDDK